MLGILELSVLITAATDGSLRARLCARPLLHHALPQSKKSIVEPLESTALYRYNPLALNPDVGFVHPATVAGRLSLERKRRSISGA